MTTIWTAEQDEQIRKILAEAVRRHIGWFDAYPHVTDDDLIAEALIALHRAWHRFDPGKGQLSTFINTVAGRKWIDVARSCERQHNRDAKAAELRPTESRPDNLKNEAGDDLADWLGQVYRAMRGMFETMRVPLRTPGMNHRYPDRAQRSALLLLKRRMGLSCRGLAMVLNERTDIRAAIRLPSPLRYRAIANLEKSVHRLGSFNLPSADKLRAIPARRDSAGVE